MKKYVKAAVGPYGNSINVEYSRMTDLKKSLQHAYDILEEMDDETFQLCDGEALIDDLDTAIREVDSRIQWYNGLEK